LPDDRRLGSAIVVGREPGTIDIGVDLASDPVDEAPDGATELADRRRCRRRRGAAACCRCRHQRLDRTHVGADLAQRSRQCVEILPVEADVGHTNDLLIATSATPRWRPPMR
jgi:hypothetical protein